MPDALPIQQFARRLAELGCPARRVRLCAQELSDHHQDLKSAAREVGMAEAAAGKQADELLGEPVALANHMAAVLRNSSWWGRHPLIGYCLIPPFAIIMVVLLFLGLEAWIGTVCLNSEELKALTNTVPGIELARSVLAGTYYATVALMSLLFCWLARRSSSGIGWALAACAVCSLHSYFFKISVAPHNLMMGYYFSSRLPQLIPPAIPLLVAAAALVWHWRSRRTLAPAFAGTGSGIDPEIPSPPRSVHFNLRKTGFLTPSSVIAGLIVSAIAWLIVTEIKRYREINARYADLRANVWPAERTATMTRLRNGQLAPSDFHGTTIDLRSHANLGLRDSINRPEDPAPNNLAGLPEGLHPFGGVPFDVSGRIQLRGRRLGEVDRTFPACARKINVGCVASRIHLLHGACFVRPELRGTNVARLTLHYADGSQAQIPIVAGAHLLDWWGPIYRTGVPMAARDPAEPSTELAWAGKNPRIVHEDPDASLRIYRSTFANPHPDREIASIGYASALTDAAPFLLGLTVE